MSCDIVLVGVGGQGVLTIADLLIRSAFEAEVPATYAPTKGMAQRGGFVKAEIRLGKDGVGPRIGDGEADLVVGMERSESLRGLRFLRPEGTFLLFDHVWEPTGVQLGNDEYPKTEQVVEEVRTVSDRVILLDPADLPSIDGRSVSPNVYVLGAMLGGTSVGDLLTTALVEKTVSARWPKASEANVAAFRAGLEAAE